jgi:two-component system chemotaxis response regulator CheB
MSIKDRGGVAIVQQPSEAGAPSMPRSALKHVAVDHCCMLEEIAPILTTLAADSPGEDAAASRVMEIENRIAGGISTVQDWLIFEEMSAPSGFNCPDCRSSLCVVPDHRMLRFRCRAGHGLSAESLISAQAGTSENAFASVLAALIEAASLLERLTRSPEFSGEPEAVAHFIRRAERLREQAEQVASWLRATIGLVESEPTGQSRA